MRVLILTCNTGGGHNSAALALENYFSNIGVECDIADFLGFGKDIANNIICNGHVFIYRHVPKLFEWGYKIAESDTMKGANSLIYKYCSGYADKLYDFLCEHKYDCIISVHVFASIALDYIKKRIDDNIVACHVTTDYTCYPEISNTDLDYYFIPHKGLIDEYVKNGISRNKIIPSGIPVRTVFYNYSSDKSEHKRKIGVDPDKLLVVVAGGSMGCGPIEDIVSLLRQRVDKTVEVAVICGSNVKTYEALKVYDDIHVCGFVDNIHDYMHAADLLLTKAGGLSVTEAAASNLPLVFINAVSGCEAYNRDFFRNQGYAVSSIDEAEVVENTVELLGNERMRNEIKAKMNNDFATPAQELIYDTLLEVVADA